MNSHIEIVKKWLVDNNPVTSEELEAMFIGLFILLPVLKLIELTGLTGLNIWLIVVAIGLLLQNMRS